MIVVLSPDDPVLIKAAQAQSYNFPETYGATYLAGVDQLPMLAADENLFVSGHGVSKGASGIAEIGNPSGDFAVGGIAFYEQVVEHIMPDMYSGGIYVDACYSADAAFDRFSFIEDLKSQLALDSEARVFGRFGEVGMDIPLPDAKGWVEAI